MTMDKKQAATIMQMLESTYGMNFYNDDTKARIWVEQLTKYGDYNKTLYQAKKHIRENKFKPSISEIVRSKPKETKALTIPVEETHEYRMKHDKGYAENRKKLKEKWARMKQDWVKENE